MREPRTFASLDIGTNSTRLLVAGSDGLTTSTIDRRMTITRLGEGVDKTRELSPGAVERTLAALREYRAVMERLGPAGVTAAATAVLRRVENRADFLDAAERVIGVRPRVLRGEEEAFASFLGAVSDVGDWEGGKVLVFDIGGGSTELISADAGPGESLGALPVEALARRSVDVGCVRMSERFLNSDPPSPVSIGRLESHVLGVLRPVLSSLLDGEPRLAIGLAGTVTTLSGIRQGLREYETGRIHHSVLKREDVEEMFRKLARDPLDERKKTMGLEPGRADVIVGGTAVLRVLMDLARLREILVSEKDILDGLVIEMARGAGEGRAFTGGHGGLPADS